MISKTEEDKHPWVKDISERDNVRGLYLVKKKKEGTTRNGKPFISITLTDRTGDIEAKVWNRAHEFGAVFSQGDIIEVEGCAESYQGQIQISISQLKKFSKKEVDQRVFIESAPSDLSGMLASLKKILRDVGDVHLSALIDIFFVDRRFVSQFKNAPAAKNFHHNYLGGLLEHTLSVCHMAVQVADHYPQLDKNLLVTAAFLHDIGKTKELEIDISIDYTDEGRLLGHLVLGEVMLEEKFTQLKDFPKDLALRLKHMILSHHGQYEFGSPKRPKFLEAIALHLIDDLDAKLNGLGRFMERDHREGAWSDFNRLFEQYFLKGKISSSKEKPDKERRIDIRQGSLFSS